MEMTDGCRVIPAVDVQDGAVVQLVGGARGTERRYGAPLAAAQRWTDAGARRLHLIDLDGAIDGERRNAAAIAAVAEAAAVPVQVGGGIRTAADARALLDLGVDQVILGTAAMADPAIITAIDRTHPGAVIASVDARDGVVLTEGWTQQTETDPVDAVTTLAAAGAAAVLFTDVAREGRLGGIDPTATRRVVDASPVPVIASGGVTSLADVVTLAGLGASAVVIGTALYEGRFSLAAAQAAVSERMRKHDDTTGGSA
jgi:phosphoribosylformimino-5-aminoimidazole carboxamide ribotide isomerase